MQSESERLHCLAAKIERGDLSSPSIEEHGRELGLALGLRREPRTRIGRVYEFLRNGWCPPPEASYLVMRHMAETLLPEGWKLEKTSVSWQPSTPKYSVVAVRRDKEGKATASALGRSDCCEARAVTSVALRARSMDLITAEDS